MATNWNNTVPQGVTGTGNAQVFGVNPVAGQFGGQLANLRRQQELEAQNLAKAWRDNQLAASEGRLWANDMAGIEKDFINRGIDLQKKGVNPYGSSPEALEYQRDKRYVQAQQGYRKKVEERLNDALTKVNANPDKYDPKTIQQIHDFFGKTKLSDAFEKNLDIPQLAERFDVNDYLKDFKAITNKNSVVDKIKKLEIEEKKVDEPATQNMLVGALIRDPRGMNYLKEMTSGFDLPEVKSFAPSYNENVKMVTDYIQGNPVERKRLAAQGILPDTPEMAGYVSDLAQKQTIARKKFDTGMKDLVAAASSGVDLSREEKPWRDPNELTEYQRQNLALRRQSEARQAAKDAREGTQDVETPRDINISYNNGKANVNVRDYVGMSVPAKSLVGLPTYNLSTGARNVRLPSSVDAKIVGVGNFPFAKFGVDGNGKSLKGTIVQPNFAATNPDAVEERAMVHIKVPVPGAANIYTDMLIPYKALPTNVKNSKAIKEALGNFRPADGVAPAPKPAATKPAATSGNIQVEVNGKVGEIPASQFEAFKKKYPTAKRLQ
jgi:hypothetical protein